MGVKAVEALIEDKHGVMTGLKGKGVDFIPLATDLPAEAANV